MIVYYHHEDGTPFTVENIRIAADKYIQQNHPDVLQTYTYDTLDDLKDLMVQYVKRIVQFESEKGYHPSAYFEGMELDTFEDMVAEASRM